MPDLVDIAHAAQALDVSPARVRALVADGSLRAHKTGGRWLVEWESVLARRRLQAGSGRRMTARNAWALLFLASGEEPPAEIDSHARWRIQRALLHDGLADLSPRLAGRADVHHFWALPSELRPLWAADSIVRTGSAAGRALGLDLVAPDAIDAYVAANTLDLIAGEHALAPIARREANVTLRSVPDDAWFLAGRDHAPAAAVALDLVSYPDSRSARAGKELIGRLDHERATP